MEHYQQLLQENREQCEKEIKIENIEHTEQEMQIDDGPGRIKTELWRYAEDELT